MGLLEFRTGIIFSPNNRRNWCSIRRCRPMHDDRPNVDRVIRLITTEGHLIQLYDCLMNFTIYIQFSASVWLLFLSTWSRQELVHDTVKCIWSNSSTAGKAQGFVLSLRPPLRLGKHKVLSYISDLLYGWENTMFCLISPNRPGRSSVTGHHFAATIFINVQQTIVNNGIYLLTQKSREKWSSDL